MDTENFKLTLEQQFQIKKLEASAHQMNKDQMLDALLEMSRILMVKENIIKNLVKQVV
ncbi:MAG: NblA/ycf18 family protein [Rivularia sp. ALOHA_DT_140]|nr:NblA/ycf18 family protein [Rivularia sp. ALOHA_DT_140]